MEGQIFAYQNWERLSISGATLAVNSIVLHRTLRLCYICFSSLILATADKVLMTKQNGFGSRRGEKTAK